MDDGDDDPGLGQVVPQLDGPQRRLAVGEVRLAVDLGVLPPAESQGDPHSVPLAGSGGGR